MPLYIMTSRLNLGVDDDPKTLQRRDHLVEDKLTTLCRDVDWQGSFATVGPYDYLDVIAAPDHHAAMKVQLAMRIFGKATTELWPATHAPIAERWSAPRRRLTGL